MDRPVIDADAAFRHHLLQVAQAQSVSQVAALAKQEKRAVEMAAFEYKTPSIGRIALSCCTSPTETFATPPLKGGGGSLARYLPPVGAQFRYSTFRCWIVPLKAKGLRSKYASETGE